MVPTRHALTPQVKVGSPAARRVLLNFTWPQRGRIYLRLFWEQANAGRSDKNSSLKFLLKSFMERFGLTCVLKRDGCAIMGEETSSGVDFLLNSQLERNDAFEL